MQYAVCGKCTHLMEHHETKEEKGVATEIGHCNIEGCSCEGFGKVPHIIIEIDDLKETYKTSDHVEFLVHVKGYGSGTGLPTVSIRKVKGFTMQPISPNSFVEVPTGEQEIWNRGFMTPEDIHKTLRDFENTIKFPSKNDLPIHVRESGPYVLVVTVDSNGFVRKKFEVK